MAPDPSHSSPAPPSASSSASPNDPSSKKVGAFLLQSQNQCNNSTSSLFPTAAAHNLVCLKLAEGLGVNVRSHWLTWFNASCVPALTSILLTPIIWYKLYPPEIKSTPNAPAAAKQKLELMGPIKRDEWVMIGTLLLTIALWIAGESLNMPSVVAAMIGVSLLLLFGVLNWDDCLTEKGAWDTLAWFTVLIGMATELTTLGVVPWMSKSVARFLKSLSLGRFGSFCILQLSYFFILTITLFLI